MAKRGSAGVGRRGFLKGAALAAGVASSTPLAAHAAPLPPDPKLKRHIPIQLAAAEAQAPPAEALTEGKGGGDFMVDVLKSLGFDYVCANPASSFRGIHEAIINYGNNAAPEFITCTHEENAVSMAQGYYKMAGKPLAVLVHAVVGLQHASMALYNAWCDRVPVFVMVGNGLDAEKRRPGVEWNHTAVDNAVIVRDYTKWDDQPASLQHFADSAVRAFKIAMTPPMGPVVIAIDAGLQEDPIDLAAKLMVPKLPRTTPPQGDSAALADTAKMLIAAESPVILVDRLARSQAGIDNLVTLAELLQAPVVDQAGRMNFPTRHPLNHSMRGRALVTQADMILGLELRDFWGSIHSFRDQIERTAKPIFKPGVKTVSIGAGDLFQHGNVQDVQHFADIDLAITGDGEETLPYLIEAVKGQIDSGRRSAFDARGKTLADQHDKSLQASREDAASAWDVSPISTGRLCAELWEAIRNEDWSFAGGGNQTFFSNWPQRLWDMTKIYHYNGDSGGAGQGYGGGAIVGAALANKAHGRLTVGIVGDGDLMYSPGALWTAAHHKIPMLMIVHGNRAYHQELMHVQRMADRHSRGIDRAHIGTTLIDPAIDFAKLAQAMGVHAEGPISDPKALGPALKRAIVTVKAGEPVLIDVVTQPR